MPKVAEIRNIALLGHGAVGKTTLLDRLLVESKAVTGEHSVENETSVSDFDPQEKAHHYSIESAVTHFEYGGDHFHLIDTPGYPDFIGQAIGALRAVETAAIVIDAHKGIEVNTRRVFEEAGKAGCGRIIVLNEMDTENIDFEGLIASLRETFGPACQLFNEPIGHGADFQGVVNCLHPEANKKNDALLDVEALHEQLMDSIVEADEEAMEAYLGGEEPTGDKMLRLIYKAVHLGVLVPIVCVSARTGVGVKEFFDALVEMALPVEEIDRVALRDGQEVPIAPDPNGPLIAQVFKTRIDPFVQKLSYIRVFSGTLRKDDQVHVSGDRKLVKMGQLLHVQGGETHPLSEAGPGEIVAVAKMDELHTGTTLGDYEMPPIPFPKPMVGLAVSPKGQADDAKLSVALHKVAEEDPTFTVEHDPQTKELVITGMSELHLQIIKERLSQRDKLEIDTKDPKIPFRETIQAQAEGDYRHKKQSGGRGQFGEVHIRMHPFPRGIAPEEFCTKERFPQLKSFHYDEDHNFLWIDSIVGGTIPGNFLPAIEKGFKERLATGVIAGYRVQDVAVEVHFGKHHPVDSSEAAFKTAARQVFRKVFEQAKPCLLEPIVRLDVTVPESHVGDVYSDISSRGGRVQGSDAAGGGFQIVHAEIPLREVTHYARTLSSMTGGQGSFSMEFAHYDVMPPNVQQEIISQTKPEEEEED